MIKCDILIRFSSLTSRFESRKRTGTLVLAFLEFQTKPEQLSFSVPVSCWLLTILVMGEIFNWKFLHRNRTSVNVFIVMLYGLNTPALQDWNVWFLFSCDLVLFRRFSIIWISLLQEKRRFLGWKYFTTRYMMKHSTKLPCRNWVRTK